MELMWEQVLYLVETKHKTNADEKRKVLMFSDQLSVEIVCI